jgi:hypothetical protein
VVADCVVVKWLLKVNEPKGDLISKNVLLWVEKFGSFSQAFLLQFAIHLTIPIAPDYR